MKKYLPFEYNPLFKTYQYLAYYFGILQRNENIIPQWVYSNFVTCSSAGFHFGDDIWRLHEDIIFRTTCKDITIGDPYSILITYVQEQLAKGFYINGIFDEYYIPNKKAYLSHHYHHDYILTGFDDDEKIFYSAGYVSNGVYQKFEITYTNFYNSITQYPNKTNSVTSINKIKVYDSNKDFELIRFCDQLYDYIKQPVLLYSEPQNGCHGLCSWKYLYNHLTLVISGSKMLDLRLCRFIMEHRGFLLLCLKYLYEKFSDLKISEIIYNYGRLVKQVQVLFYTCVKFTLKKDVRILYSILPTIRDIYYQEYRLLSDILSNISGSMTSRFDEFLI